MGKNATHSCDLKNTEYSSELGMAQLKLYHLKEDGGIIMCIRKFHIEVDYED